MKIPNIIHRSINALQRLALASGVSALVALSAGSAQALTTTIELGAQDNGTAIGQGAKVLKIAKSDLPVGSILRSVAINARVDVGDPYCGDICVFTADSDGANGVLLVGDYDPGYGGAPAVTTNVLWDAGIAYGVGTTVNKTITTGIPAIDLNSYAIFLTSGYGGTWSGSITLTYDGPAAAGIARRGTATTATVTSGATMTIANPGALEGDVMLVNIAQRQDGSGPAAASGWTVIKDGNFGNGNRWGTILYKVATADDAVAASFDFTLTPSISVCAVGAMVAFSGVDTASPLDAVGPNFWQNTDGAQWNIKANGITTDVDGAAVIMFGILAFHNGLAAANVSDYQTASSPGALTELYDNKVEVLPNSATVCAAWAIQTTAGPTGDGQALMSVQGQRNAGYLIALRPVDNSAKDFLTFGTNVVGSSAIINTADATVAWTVPFGSDVTKLTPEFTYKGASVDPASGTEIDFSTSKTYTITAVDNSTKDYTVTVTVAPYMEIPVTAGLVVWVKADAVDIGDTNQVRVVGADVFIKQWNDSSGAGRNATNATENDQPKYIADALNGKPAIRFTEDDSNNGDRLYLGDLSAQTPSAGSAFVVATPNEATTNTGYTLFDNRSNDGRWISGTSQYNESTPGTFRQNRDGSFNTDAIKATWPKSGSHVFAMESSSSVYRYLIDGTALPAGTAEYNSGSGQNWTIGNRAQGGEGGSQLNGDIAEVVIFNRVLTSAEANAVGGYLAGKYGVTTTTYPIAAPAAPAGLTATGVAGAVGLSWTASTYAAIYNVQRSETSGSGYVTLGTATSTSYADSTATLGTTYYYVVTAQNSVGTSPISNEAGAARLVSSVNNIVSFGPGAAINGNSIVWVVPSGTDVTSLTPGYTVSPWATKDPANPSGTVNFTNPQTYTVIAEDNSTKTYTVMVMVYAAPITYNFDDATLQGWHNRVWDLSAGDWVDLAQNVYAMPAAINGGVIQPPSSENGLYGPRDNGVNQVGGNGDNHYNSLWVRSPEFYLAVTGDLTVSLDGGQRNVNPPANDASVISTAVHQDQGGGFQGVALRRVSDGVFVLKANRTGFSQAALNALGSAGPYTLELINTDRGDWGWIAMDNVSIPGVLAPPKDITSFAVTPYGSATIIGNNITLSVPPGTNVTALVPAITINGVSVSPASGIARDFTSTVDYTVTALDGSTKIYHVTISVPPVFATTTTLDISSGATGLEILTDGNLVEANHCGNNLSPLTIQGVLPFGTDESHIIAHGSDGTDNWSGFDAIADDNFRALMKHVRWYQGTGYEMSIPGLIVGHTYRLQLISVEPNNVGVVVQGTSLGAWSGNNTLVTVTWVQPESKGSNLDVAFIRNGGEPKLNGYVLHDMALPGDGKDITSFTIAGIPATISGTNITLKMPFGLGWPNLTPTIEVSPLATVSPASEVVQDFTGTITYTVTCANPGPPEETTKVYTVNVTEALDGPAVINVNYSGGTNANMNGVYTDDATARGSASQVAPATYGGTTWNDLGQPSNNNFDASNLKNSKGADTGVNLDTSMDTGIWADWSGLGGNKMLISGVQSGTTDYSTILTLTGLDPANTYDLYIAGQHNTGNDTRNYRVGATIKSKAFAGATDWTEGQTHVKFAGLIPSPTGTLVVEGSNHAMVNGFQLQDMGARSLNPEALIYTFGSITLGVSTVPSDDQIKLVVPIGTALNGFAPDITCSAGATLTPATATGQDFSTGPVTYTVVSEDGLTTSIYYATVILDPAAITSAALNISSTDTGAEILNTGTLVEANHFGGVSDGILAPAAVTLDNGPTFGLDPAHMTSGWFAMHSTAAWSGAAAIENIPYKTLLGNVFWVAYGESVSHLDIPALTVGHNYRLQLVSVNPESCKVAVEGGTAVTWLGSVPSLLTATWTATDTTANVVLTRAQGGGEINFNGYALHDMNPPASFSGLTPTQSIPAGTATVTLSGTVSAPGPLYPADGETVHVTINGVTQDTAISGDAGAFSIDFVTSTIPAGDYPITYTYDGNATLVKAKDVSTTLTVTGGGGGYGTWATDNAPGGTSTGDFDGDGVSNGVEYVLGGTKLTNDLAKLPKVSTTPDGNLVFTFQRALASKTADTAVAIGVSLDLSDWTPYQVGTDTASSASEVTVGEAVDGYETVTLSVPMAPDAKKFARLQVIVTGP